MAGTLPMAADSAAGVKTAAPVRRRLWLRVAAGGAAVLVIAAVGVWFVLAQTGAAPIASGETARAARDRMVVTITESGEIDAKRSVDIRCEVEGQSTVIWAIEEGTVAKQGDKLVEMDSADLQERLRSQDMVHKTAKAAFEKADKAYAIQESTRQSLLSTAGLTVKFGLLDLKRYLGTDLANRFIADEGKAGFDALVKDPTLGGAALQQQRKLQSDIDLVAEELSRAASKVEWTRTLKEKGYVTGSELEADELAWKRQQVALDQAKTALDLFLVYEFPKAAEKAYTDWLESKREYDRVDARTQSELDSARATRDNARDSLSLEDTRLKKVQEQLEKTTIKAPQPGLVVYYTEERRGGQSTMLEAGATIRHQQTLIRLPDMSEMNVKVKLHESVVKQASEGAPAYITIDAFPTDRLTGRVTKIAIMPDRSQWWMNPGLKQYVTEVTLDSTPAGLKPGMSAQVEILVATRDSVLQVPISAVHVDKGFQVVYAKTLTGVEVRRVEAGLSNDRTVEITKGLEAGDEVYLFKPQGAPELVVSEEEIKAKQEAEWKARAAEAAAKAPALPGAAALENLTPEKAKALRDQLEKLPADQREKVLKRMRENGEGAPRTPSGGATGNPSGGRGDRPPRGLRGGPSGPGGDKGTPAPKADTARERPDPGKRP